METLFFKNCRIITQENYKDLAPVYLEQMGITAGFGFGEEFTTAEDLLEQSGDGDMEDAEVELWDVVAENEPNKVLYNCWVYLADTANVFEAGTAIDIGIGMCQWSFELLRTTEDKAELLDALQEAFDLKYDDTEEDKEDTE